MKRSFAHTHSAAANELVALAVHSGSASKRARLETNDREGNDRAPQLLTQKAEHSRSGITFSTTAERYSLEGRIGGGVYGTVLKAIRAEDAAVCAIKLSNVESEESSRVDGLSISSIREASVLNALRGVPGIVQ
jgi:serine/threonine protein kinase